METKILRLSLMNIAAEESQCEKISSIMDDHLRNLAMRREYLWEVMQDSPIGKQHDEHDMITLKDQLKSTVKLEQNLESKVKDGFMAWFSEKMKASVIELLQFCRDNPEELAEMVFTTFSDEINNPYTQKMSEDLKAILFLYTSCILDVFDHKSEQGLCYRFYKRLISLCKHSHSITHILFFLFSLFEVDVLIKNEIEPVLVEIWKTVHMNTDVCQDQVEPFVIKILKGFEESLTKFPWVLMVLYQDLSSTMDTALLNVCVVQVFFRKLLGKIILSSDVFEDRLVSETVSLGVMVKIYQLIYSSACSFYLHVGNGSTTTTLSSGFTSILEIIREFNTTRCDSLHPQLFPEAFPMFMLSISDLFTLLKVIPSDERSNFALAHISKHMERRNEVSLFIQINGNVHPSTAYLELLSPMHAVKEYDAKRKSTLNKILSRANISDSSFFTSIAKLDETAIMETLTDLESHLNVYEHNNILLLALQSSVKREQSIWVRKIENKHERKQRKLAKQFYQLRLKSSQDFRDALNQIEKRSAEPVNPLEVVEFLRRKDIIQILPPEEPVHSCFPLIHSIHSFSVFKFTEFMWQKSNSSQKEEIEKYSRYFMDLLCNDLFNSRFFSSTNKDLAFSNQFITRKSRSCSSSLASWFAFEMSKTCSPYYKLVTIRQLEERIVDNISFDMTNYKTRTIGTDKLLNELEVFFIQNYPFTTNSGSCYTDIFMDMQMIAYLIPSSMLDMREEGKSFWDFALTLLKLGSNAQDETA